MGEGLLTSAPNLCIFDSEQMCSSFEGAEEFALAVENWLAFLFGLIHISLLQHKGRVGAFECVQMFTILAVNKSCFSIFLV